MHLYFSMHSLTPLPRVLFSCFVSVYASPCLPPPPSPTCLPDLSTPYFSFLLGIGARGRPEPRGNEGGQPNSTHLSSPQTELSSSPQPAAAAAPSGVTGGRPEASKVNISSATARAPTETPRGGLLVSRPLQELGGVRGEGQLAEQEVITVDLPDLSRLPEQPRSLGMSFQNLCLFYTFLFY